MRVVFNVSKAKGIAYIAQQVSRHTTQQCVQFWLLEGCDCEHMWMQLIMLIIWHLYYGASSTSWVFYLRLLLADVQKRSQPEGFSADN